MLDTTRSRSSSSQRARRAASSVAVAVGVMAAGLRIVDHASAMPVTVAMRRVAKAPDAVVSSASAVGRTPVDRAIAAILAQPLRQFAVLATSARARQPMVPIKQNAVDLSGTWVADTTSIVGPYREAYRPGATSLKLTVVEKRDMIGIAQNGRPPLVFPEGYPFGGPSPDVNWTWFVPLDGTVGVAKLTGSGTRVASDRLVKGAWLGDTLVLTTWSAKMDSISVWKEVDRLSLAGDGSLVEASTIFALGDTLMSKMSFTKAQ